MNDKIRFELDQEEIPKKWYNIIPDLPEKLPRLKSPLNGDEIKQQDLEPLFASELVKQEFDFTSKFIDIPSEVREKYFQIRPSPLIRAKEFEKALKTKVRIYFKYEGEKSPTGSHKINTALAQAYYNKKEGIETLTTETGAGQWGSALSFATSTFGLKCKVFMVRASYDQKPHRKTLMELFGAEIYPSPSEKTDFGKAMLQSRPDHPGSLGIAISEAIATAVQDNTAKYSLGSVLNHVLMHQSIIGLEAEKQFQNAEDKKVPDILVGCVGGGSNFAGLVYPFLRHTLYNGNDVEVIAAESSAAPKMCTGEYKYDHGDTAKMTPLLKMYTLGPDYIPPPVHAGGLRYHGAAPSLSLLVKTGHVTPIQHEQLGTFKAAEIFAKAEGIIPAPESSHAIASVIDVAKKYKDEEKTLIFNLSGHGLFDLYGYQKYLSNSLI